ncbi:MAG: hypothetical protein ABIJ12_04305 [bacterium]
MVNKVIVETSLITFGTFGRGSTYSTALLTISDSVTYLLIEINM